MVKQAQELSDNQLKDSLNLDDKTSEDAVVIFDEEPDGADVVELSPLPHQEIKEVKFVLPTLPGCDEEPLEVSTDDAVEVADSPKESEKSGPKDIWDWSAHGSEKFMDWAHEILKHIPKHNGKSTGGIERALSFLKKYNNELSKAVQNDLDGKIDINKFEEARAACEDGIMRLEERLEELLGQKKNRKKKAELEKSAQKAPHVGGIIITVPIFISRVARTCINSSVSAGHNIEWVFNEQVKRFKLSEREQEEVIQLLSDMNYPIRRDRLYKLNDEVDTTSSDNGDWVANYPA
jgi:hypothetical protein